jgi:DNA-binding transcriptional MerR regulator
VSEPTPERGDLRIDDLAHAAGTTVRNVRAYQDKGLLPPPRRDGRVAWYSPAHLARVRLVGSLLERGFTLANIGELLDRWGQGQELGDLLGLGRQLTGPFTDEVADTGTPAEITERYGLDLDDLDAAAESLRLGLVEIAPDGATIRVPSPRLLRAGVELHRAGMPYADLFAELHRLRADVEAIAERFVHLVTRTVIEPRLVDGLPIPGEAAELGELVQRIRPLATTVVSAELARALRLRARAELGERLSDAVAAPAHIEVE